MAHNNRREVRRGQGPSQEQVRLFDDIEKVPAGEWIALSSDESRLVAHSASLQDALALARKKGERNPVLMKAEAAGQLIVG